ncbi:hypothetical protein BBK82_44000 [Lentzea guizhouensis]|uniref:Uncharacterized protein n=1 Tax=Lentzea guizhouensis TaxID=1586287 RepID=A0A1B2HVV6_9PSEU|nr:hypothetical protein BBK82_44000 [Lentzea guizhouensis]
MTVMLSAPAPPSMIPVPPTATPPVPTPPLPPALPAGLPRVPFAPGAPFGPVTPATPMTVIVSLPPRPLTVPLTGPPVMVMMLSAAVPSRTWPAGMPAVQTKLLPVCVHPGGIAWAAPGATKANPATVPKPTRARPKRRAVPARAVEVMITLHPWVGPS